MSKFVEKPDIFMKRFRQVLDQEEVSFGRLAAQTGFAKSTLHNYASGKRLPSEETVVKIANALEVKPEWLAGYRLSIDDNAIFYPDGVVTFPILGDVATGYDRCAYEDWSGETVSVPVSALKGRRKEDFFVLRGKGDSMYPEFLEGDKVLILAQDVVENCHVAVVIYEGELGTLKKVEFERGRVRLIPFNTNYKPITISGPDLDYFRVLGVPRMIMRDCNY